MACCVQTASSIHFDTALLRQLAVEKRAAHGLQAERPGVHSLMLLVVPHSWFAAVLQVGSVFEYFDGNAVFGVIPPDSPLWAPVLGLFAFTGIPMAGGL